MDVTAAGTSPTIAESPGRASSSPAPGGAPRDDGASPQLQLLATPQIHSLLNGIEAHRNSATGGATGDMHLNAAGSAVANHDVPRALAHLTEYVRSNPGHAGTLLSTPSLISIQGDVQGLLRHMTHEARFGAENTLAAARLAVAAGPEFSRTLNGLDVLAVADRFAESGQLLNYIRASELGNAVIAAYLPMVSRKRDSVLRRELPNLLTALWRRVPMLVLLAGWFLLGAVSGTVCLLARLAGVALPNQSVETGFEAWSIGFLALAGFQFCLSLRRTQSENTRPE